MFSGNEDAKQRQGACGREELLGTMLAERCFSSSSCNAPGKRLAVAKETCSRHVAKGRSGRGPQPGAPGTATSNGEGWRDAGLPLSHAEGRSPFRKASGATLGTRGSWHRLETRRLPGQPRAEGRGSGGDKATRTRAEREEAVTLFLSWKTVQTM